MGRFEEATAVTRLGEGRYRADLDLGFGIGAGAATALNGGYLMAVLLRAVADSSPHPHPVVTSTSFLRVGRPGPAEVLVERRRTGRTASVSRATLVQDDAPIVDAQVTTGTLDSAAEASWSAGMPRLPPVAECRHTELTERERGFVDRVDMRFDPATLGWLDGRPLGRPAMRAWLRLREGGEPDPFVLALAVDALPPVALNVASRGWSPTVELTWHMRAVPAPGWLAVHGSGRLISDGWFDEEVEVWDSAGRLVAQSRQIARLGRGSPE